MMLFAERNRSQIWTIESANRCVYVCQQKKKKAGRKRVGKFRKKSERRYCCCLLFVGSHLQWRDPTSAFLIVLIIFFLFTFCSLQTIITFKQLVRYNNNNGFHISTKLLSSIWNREKYLPLIECNHVYMFLHFIITTLPHYH